MARRLFRQPVAVASLVLLAVVVLLSIAGGRLLPYRYDEPSTDRSEPPSWQHPMGTDDIGRDVLSRVARGTEKSVQVALLVTVVATAAGTVLGAAAGYYRGWVDAVLSRLTDLVLTIPVLAILLVFAARVSTKRGNTVLLALVIAGVTWPGIFRVVRSIFLSLREREWVEAARAAGAPERRIVVRHVLPAAAGPIIVAATLTVAWAILAEAALGFLGFGLSSPDVSLGSLVEGAQISSTNRPWLFYFPGAVLLLICLCVNFVGDGLRAAIDPRSSEVFRHRAPSRWNRRTT